MINVIQNKEDALAHIEKVTSRLSAMSGDSVRFKTFAQEQTVPEIVTEILKKVEKEGDVAVVELLSKIDKVTLQKENLIVSPLELEQARNSLDSKVEGSLQLMAKRIEDYAKQMMPELIKWFPEKDGRKLGYRFTPVENIGAYVPGGLGGLTPLISTVLMNLIPAKVAGVKRIVVATPPGKGGVIHPALLRACELAGATVVYKAGGAQGVAAMAYGTESCPKCSKIIGPGNAFVQEAKRQLYGLIDIDMMAGPSEIGILADKTANPKVVAADMLAQAEHDPFAASVVISDSKELLTETARYLSVALEILPKKEIAKQSLLNYGALLYCENINEGCDWVNALAPEHLEVILENSDDILSKIKHAGAIFIGPWTPEVVGDYTAGPSHTLPTCGAARFASGINVYSFLKSSSLLNYTESAMKNDLEALTTMARAENLEGHARSAESRFKESEK